MHRFRLRPGPPEIQGAGGLTPPAPSREASFGAGAGLEIITVGVRQLLDIGGTRKGSAMTGDQITIHTGGNARAGVFPAPLGGPRALLRVEAAMVAIACAIAFYFIRASWLMFAILFFALDLSIAFYWTGPRIGSAAYNAAHCYIGPILLVLAGHLSGWRSGDAVTLIWAAHIGFDRALGYGLKYASAFSDTHLGQIGTAVGKRN